MSTNDKRNPPNDSTSARAGNAQVAELASDLNALTDLMEAEWNEAGIISSENALRLTDLRVRFERLLAK